MSQKQILTLFQILCILISSIAMAKAKMAVKTSVSYEVSMPQPSSHYVTVKMTIDLSKHTFGKEYVEVKMPVWTPGSYLVREYARNVDAVEAFDNSQKLVLRKTAKNTWKIQTKGAKSVVVQYPVYANELSVRTSHVDDSHAYLNGASIFMYVPELMKGASIIKIIPHESFKKISVALDEVEKNTFLCPNYDLLVDSFFEIGNQEILEFDYEGIKHTIANYSLVPLNYKKEELINSYLKVVKAAHSVFPVKHPCKNYLFVVHHLPNIGGGLEHLNGTTCQTSPETYDDPEKQRGFFGLIAHEYFHLWNVKRLRPEALGPFDYEKENYSNMLWVSEGFTAFYQEDILRRNKMFDTDKYLTVLAQKIAAIENAPGNKVQSVADASWDAWIKFYRPNENSNNTTISYYTKGSVVAMVLNAIIIDGSSATKSLDDALLLLYKEKYLAADKGFTDEEFRLACEKVSGRSLKVFFEKYIFGTETLPYQESFEKIGLEYKNELLSQDKPVFGAVLRGNMVSRVDRGTTAYGDGLNVGDQILEVNGKAYLSGAGIITSGANVGDKLTVKILRNNVQQSLNFVLGSNNTQHISLKMGTKLDVKTEMKMKKFLHL